MYSCMFPFVLYSLHRGPSLYPFLFPFKFGSVWCCSYMLCCTVLLNFAFYNSCSSYLFFVFNYHSNPLNVNISCSFMFVFYLIKGSFFLVWAASWAYFSCVQTVYCMFVCKHTTQALSVVTFCCLFTPYFTPTYI